eukprot:1171415-Rhodomonas_salina.2
MNITINNSNSNSNSNSKSTCADITVSGSKRSLRSENERAQKQLHTDLAAAGIFWDGAPAILAPHVAPR